MDNLPDDLFAQAEAALRFGTSAMAKVTDCRRLAPLQRERLLNGISRLIDRIALSTRLVIETYQAGDLNCHAAATAILVRHLSLANESLPAIDKRISEGLAHA